MLMTVKGSAPNIWIALLLCSLIGCGDSDTDSDSTMIEAGMAGEGGAAGEGGTAGNGGSAPIAIYSFESKYDGDGESASYSGQSARHALISDLKRFIGTLEMRVAADANFASTLSETLNLMYTCSADLNNDGSIGDDEKGLCDGESHGVTLTLPTEQTTFGDISGGKSLNGKIAGADAVGQSTNWETEGVKGWIAGELLSPDQLVTQWLELIATNAVQISNGEFEKTPDNQDITKPYVTGRGLDLAQLVQKFLLGAVAFSQGADDYLDYDEVDANGVDLVGAGKGLYADNTALKDGKKYTPLEHTWDEGFGYFGAARDYLNYTDDELAGKGGRENYQGYHDSDENGRIDLVSEYNWGHSVNAAKRDRGHTTDFTHEAFMAFYEGRSLIAQTNGALSETAFDELKALSDRAVLAWEKAIAATVIHYINDTLNDMNAEEYDFYAHAKHWSELKGFALSFQFNRRSPMSAEDFDALHSAIGVSPVFPSAVEAESYKDGLLTARAFVGNIYGFETSDVETW